MVVSPHPVIRNLRERGPHGDGFLGFLGLPVTVRGGKDIHQNGKAIGKLKGEFSTLPHSYGRDTEFLLDFPYSALERRFAQMETPTWTVDFTSALAAFFVDQQHLARTDDEEQRRTLLRVPESPGYVVKAGIHSPI